MADHIVKSLPPYRVEGRFFVDFSSAEHYARRLSRRSDWPVSVEQNYNGTFLVVAKYRRGDVYVEGVD